MRIGELGRRFGLSRSTLLYYDRHGVLRPSGRRPNGYREYTAADVERLRKVVLYRQAGLALAQISELCDGPRSRLAAVLEKQLFRLGDEVERLHERQRLIARLLGKPRLLEKARVMNRATWTGLLRAAGFDEAAMARWHRDFERLAPGRHARFLELLGIPDEEIAPLRRRSRVAAGGPRSGSARRRGRRVDPATARRGSSRTSRR